MIRNVRRREVVRRKLRQPAERIREPTTFFDREFVVRKGRDEEKFPEGVELSVVQTLDEAPMNRVVPKVDVVHALIVPGV